MDVITYPCWDSSYSMLVKGAPDIVAVDRSHWSYRIPESSDIFYEIFSSIKAIWVKPAWWLNFGQICLCKCSIGWIIHSHPSNTSLIDTHTAHLKTNIFKVAWVFKKCLKCVNMFLFGLSEQKYAHFHHDRRIYVHISNILCCSLEVTVLM